MSSCTLDNFYACKDPSELLDYTIDYSVVLNATNPADSIATSVWTIDPAVGLVVENENIFEDEVTIWVSGGGKLESRYKLINHMTTITGREFERTILIIIRNK